MSAELLPVRCSGCKTQIGWSKSATPLRNSVYCSEECMTGPPAPRDRETVETVLALARAGTRPSVIARLLELDRGYTYRIIKNYGGPHLYSSLVKVRK